MFGGLTVPGFWREGPTGLDFAASVVLAPFGWLYASGAYCRMTLRRALTVKPVVICVGNAVAGGAGKTPICEALGRAAVERGLTVHFLTRGYGGSEAGPLLVDPERHTAGEVGDEALLLAAIAPTWVSRDRAAGALCAAGAGAEAIVMDDGFQNPAVRKDFSILAIDGGFGFGNGLPMPAGPLREFKHCALARTDRIVVVGDTDDALLTGLAGPAPVSRARLQPVDDLASFIGNPVIAFAGIGRPEKFFDTLKDAGLDLVKTIGFPDHHAYGQSELRQLKSLAATKSAALLTTAKDHVRLPADFQTAAIPIAVDLEFVAGAGPDAILTEALANG